MPFMTVTGMIAPAIFFPMFAMCIVVAMFLMPAGIVHKVL